MASIYTAEFNSEISKVCADNNIVPAKVFTYISNEPGYSLNEFSYADDGNGNYTIRGGSNDAVNSGTQRLLRELGFRYYGDGENFILRPTSIRTGLSRAKGVNPIKYPSWG
jgi:hypothetical protein